MNRGNAMEAPGDISLLYVEDETESREFLSKAFRQRYPELEVHVEADAEKGLESFRRYRHEIVITDINLPVKSGIQLAAEIRTLQPETELIALTAYSDSEYLLDAIGVGINHYILKPVQLDSLFSVVEKSIARIRINRKVEHQYAIIRKLSQAIEQSPLGVMITDAAGVVEYANREFSTMTGYDRDELVGCPLFAGEVPHLPGKVHDDIQCALAEASRWSGEIENCRKGGDVYWESVSVSPVHDEDGEVSNFIIVREEITARIRDRQQIESLNAELAHKAAELETTNRDLESFNYTVAHDLRTPLVTIKGLVDLLLLRQRTVLDPQSLENLVWINGEIVRLNGLIGAILRFTSDARKTIDKRWIDLSSIVQEVAAQLRAREPLRQVDLTIARPAFAYCDPVLMRIVLENLIDNAWKFTATRDNARIEFGRRGDDEPPVFFVRDNGAGFEEKDADGLFDAFRRAQGECVVEGYGIGLATVQKIIQRHGGRIWAVGEAGKGAVFSFSL